MNSLCTPLCGPLDSMHSKMQEPSETPAPRPNPGQSHTVWCDGEELTLEILVDDSGFRVVLCLYPYLLGASHGYSLTMYEELTFRTRWCLVLGSILPAIRCFVLPFLTHIQSRVDRC